MTVDLLAIAAHPDDVELTCGGVTVRVIPDSAPVAPLRRPVPGARALRPLLAYVAATAVVLTGVLAVAAELPPAKCGSVATPTRPCTREPGSSNSRQA